MRPRATRTLASNKTAFETLTGFIIRVPLLTDHGNAVSPSIFRSSPSRKPKETTLDIEGPFSSYSKSSSHSFLSLIKLKKIIFLRILRIFLIPSQWIGTNIEFVSGKEREDKKDALESFLRGLIILFMRDGGRERGKSERGSHQASGRATCYPPSF